MKLPIFNNNNNKGDKVSVFVTHNIHSYYTVCFNLRFFLLLQERNKIRRATRPEDYEPQSRGRPAPYILQLHHPSLLTLVVWIKFVMTVV
jgi:hypothetical protein